MTIPNSPLTSSGAIQANVDRVVPAYSDHLDRRGYSAKFVLELARTARHMMASDFGTPFHLKCVELPAAVHFQAPT